MDGPLTLKRPSDEHREIASYARPGAGARASVAIERPERSGQNNALAPTETAAGQSKTAKTLLR